MTAPIYVLGTGLSHNGSAVLLRDGKVCVGIEKERLTRRKRDGGNDSAAIAYCLDAAGITLADVALVVQAANFEVPARHSFAGARPFAASEHPPLVSISHHLAHAWSVAGTAPFDSCAIMVIDGCGSPVDQCTDLDGADLLVDRKAMANGYWCEKDSFYHFDGHDVVALVKDFSTIAPGSGGPLRMDTTRDSIGGFYAAISRYVFGNMDDAGKLMGLAPYGHDGAFERCAFRFDGGRVHLTDDWQASLDRPAADYAALRADFQYYADVARWAQQQVLDAVATLFQQRLGAHSHAAVGYAGGVALNAVSNAGLLDAGIVDRLYLEPAAGDNGIALGCAYYGWIKALGRQRVVPDGNTCFGRTYDAAAIDRAVAAVPAGCRTMRGSDAELVAATADLLAAGKTVGWFRDGSEFGPRALGRRSILAHPGAPGRREHINAAIKFREDFRPFAPATLPEHVADYFEAGRDSPYMILVDRTREAHRAALANVTHVDGTARVQTVERDWNPLFADLITAFGARSGIPVLLNTSFNKRGMPIVERPEEAVALFAETALDALMLQDRLIVKGGAV